MRGKSRQGVNTWGSPGRALMQEEVQQQGVNAREIPGRASMHREVRAGRRYAGKSLYYGKDKKSLPHGEVRKSL